MKLLKQIIGCILMLLPFIGVAVMTLKMRGTTIQFLACLFITLVVCAIWSAGIILLSSDKE